MTNGETFRSELVLEVTVEIDEVEDDDDDIMIIIIE